MEAGNNKNKEIIQDDNNIIAKGLETEKYGQVQTLCDIIKVLNDKNHYKTVNALFKDLVQVMARYVERGTISQNAIRILKAGLCDINDIIINGEIDMDKLRKVIFMKNHIPNTDHIETIMEEREAYKLVSLIKYMNEFRRYTSFSELKDDFCINLFRGTVSSCIDFNTNFLNDKMLQNVPVGGHAYPFYSLLWAMKSMWNKISTNGVLDNRKLQEEMINRYQKDKTELGIVELLKEHYIADGPCHPEVLNPHKGEYFGPVIVKQEHGRQYIESCGEGKGPNQADDYFEFNLFEELIESDPKYVTVDTGEGWGHFIIPKEDYTLPVYGFLGKEEFDNENDKVQFIKKMLEVSKLQQKTN